MEEYKPDDIPTDVWAAADEALDTMLCNNIEASGSSEQFRADSVRAIADAILADRKRPVWVWLYVVSEQRAGRSGMPPLSIWPQAHSYAFYSEADALEHARRSGWERDHSYTLQKVSFLEPPKE